MSTSKDVGISQEIRSFSMCRFCAEEIDKNDIIDIKLEVIYGKYMKLLSFLKLDLDLSEDNKLPKHACLECHNKCMDCYNFFLVVENSQKELAILYNESKDHIIMTDPIKILEDSSKSQIKPEMQDNSPVHSNIDSETNVNKEALESNTMQQRDFNFMEYSEDMVEDNIDQISNSDMNITYLYKEEIDEDNSHFSDDVITDDKTDCDQFHTPNETSQVKNNKSESNDHIVESVTDPNLINTPVGAVSMYFIEYNSENDIKTTEIIIDDNELIKTVENLIASNDLEKDALNDDNDKNNDAETTKDMNDVMKNCSIPNKEADNDGTFINNKTEKYLETSKEPNSNLTNESLSFDIETVENSQSNNELEANTTSSHIDSIDTEPGAVENLDFDSESDDSMTSTWTDSSLEEDYSWDDYPWYCDFCKEKFDSINDLREHSKCIHDRCHAFSCPDCNDDFHIFNCFVEHVRTHREHLRLYCQYCNQKFEDKTECFEHAISHWSGSEKICGLCGEIFEDQESLTAHNKLYKGRRVSNRMASKIPEVVEENDCLLSWKDYEWSCLDCFRVLPDVQSLRVHVREIHSKCFAMKCADCLLFRNDYFTLVKHVRRHRPYLSNFCEYCNQYFLDPSELKSHVDNHYKDENPCYGCGEIFKTKELLQQHIIDFKATTRYKLMHDKISFSCKECPKHFSQLCKLNTHKLIHNKKYCVCEFCGKVVNKPLHKEHLKLHHEAEKGKYVCEVCKKHFKTANTLKVHAKTHLKNEKPYICDHCGKSFKLKHTMSGHIQTHSGVKPFVCIVCNKGFRYKNGLEIHSNQHTGLRPVKCKMCDRTFANNSNCNKHMIRIHGVPYFKSKITPIGKLAVDQVTGEVESVTMDDKAIEWLNKITSDKKKKKTKK